jgi:outer membrane protein assembly factor BamA
VAAQRLLDSGLFKQVGYRTKTAGNKVTITFQVEEAAAGDSPVVFDNFIWFTDEQLFDAVRKEVPTFAGRAPNAGKMPEAITRALQQLLTEHKIPGKVEYLAAQTLSGRMVGHGFSVTGVKMPICKFHFPGAKNVPESKLIATSKAELADTDYSRELIRGFAGMKLYSIYRELGQLRARFATPVGKPDSSCENGVDVTIPVEEGLIYSFAPTVWSGASVLSTEELSRILDARHGEVANGIKFDKGIGEVMKAYGRQGYLDARVRPTPEFDDTERRVTYKIDIIEGPQYRMGSLLFKGLAERDAKALRDGWRLPRGEVFNDDYLNEFFKRSAGGALARLFEERQAAGKPPPRLGSRTTPNKETLTVDVTLELGPDE